MQEALAVAKVQTQALKIPVKVPLGGGRYAELTEWNGTKRVDLRFWETDTIPTKYGVSLSFSQWKVLCSATQMMDDLIGRAKDGKHVDWRYHLGEDVYFIIRVITKLPYSELYEWKELKKTITLFEEREPELTIDNV